MRTTLDIDDEVLAAVKELARRENASAGQVVSRLLHQSLTGGPAAPRTGKRRAAVGGFRPFSGAKVASNDQVNALRDAEGV